VAAAIPEVLAKVNPDAYRKVGAHFGTESIQDLAAMASRAGISAEDAARYNDAAIVLGHITGLKLNQPAKPAEPVNDELAAARAEIQRLKYGQNEQFQARVGSAFNSRLDRELNSDVEKALAPLKDSSDPLLFESLKSRMVSEMRQKALGNPAIFQELKAARSEMVKDGQLRDMDVLARLWRQGYRDHLLSARRQYLKAAGFSITRQADDARAVMQQAQNKTAPSQGTAPMQSTSVPGRQPGEDTRAWISRTMQSRRAG